jgi:hypothetical protein
MQVLLGASKKSVYQKATEFSKNREVKNYLGNDGILDFSESQNQGVTEQEMVKN